MPNSVLVTGGAGFIGGHLVSRLLDEGHRVRVLDSLLPQVHGDGGTRPEYLADDAELVVGDMRNAEAVAKALVGIDQVVHLCARVGVGQSMYEISDYVGVNATGTGVLLQALLEHPVERLVVASSMSVYGEGLYLDGAGRPHAATRRREQLETARWEPTGPSGQPLTPVPTPETKAPALSSVYALTKYDQERLCLLFGDAYQVPTVALRFFNVYGPHQALSNPYTGVLAIFAARLLNGRPPLIFEDGEQRRDFVSVHDVAGACTAALVSERAAGMVLNVGSGRSISVNEIAARLGRILGLPELHAQVTGKFRVGDIRHCFADVSLAQEVLGYRPSVDLDRGMAELAGWLEGQVVVDRVEAAASDLAARGLTL